MKISVIVPVFNGEAVLNQCVDSLLAQTYQELEILIINDGSTDLTREIAQEYQLKNKNIRVIHKENEGLPQARKTGVENAKGEYIGFIDADDWAEPDMFERLYEACVRNDSKAVSCSFWWDYERKRIPASALNMSEKILNREETMLELNMRKKIFPYMWNKLFHKELFDTVVFPVGNFVGEDYFLVSQLLCSIKKMVWLPQPLYHYVQTINSMCRGGYSADYRIAYYNYEKRCVSLSEQFPKLKLYFENYFLTELMSFLIAMGKNGQYDQEMICNIKTYAIEHKQQYLKARYIDHKYKISIAVLCIDYRILTAGYKVLAHIKKNMFERRRKV